MDFVTLLKIMFRRWFVVIPVLAATAALGVVFIGEPEVRYASGGSELLVTEVVDDGTDATAAIQTISTSAAGGVLTSALSLQSYRGSLEDRDLVGDYTIEPDQAFTVLTITVVSNNEVQVLETGQAIVAEAQSVLETAVGAEHAQYFKVAPVGSITAADVVKFGVSDVLTFALVILPVAGEPVVGSPFPPSLLTARALVDLSRRSPVLQAVRQVAPTAVYSVTTEERDAAPIVNIALEGATPAEVEPAYRALVDALNVELQDLQLRAGGDEAGDRTVLSTLTPPTQVQQTKSSIVRSAAGFALLGFAVACGLAILVDGWILRRREKKQARAEQERESEGDSDPDQDDDLNADDQFDETDDPDSWVEHERLRASAK